MKFPYRAGKGSVLTFMLGGIVSSELAYLISLENKRADFDRKTSAQISISKSIIERLKAGTPVDVQKELLAANNTDDTTLASILESLEAGDSRWGEAKGGILTKTDNDEANNTQSAPRLTAKSSPGSGEKDVKSKGTWL